MPRSKKTLARGRSSDACPGCGSSKVVWRGFRYNENSKKHLRLCRGCGFKFTPDDGYWRMRFGKDIIRKAVTFYTKGFSLAEVKLKLEREERVKVSRWTILKWYNKYKRA